MGYLRQMMPHSRLAARALQEFPLRRLVFHAINNSRTSFFQPRNDYGEGFIAPNTIYLEPTMICNRRCDGCYPENLGTSSKIEERLAQHIFDTAKEIGVHYVAWIGGEPLTPLVQDITLGVSERNPTVNVVLCNNGDYLNRGIADRIEATDNITPSLSVDGFRESHDKRRGNGSYQHVLQAMALLKERRILFGYSTTLNSGNFLEVTSERFVDEMIGHGAFIGYYCPFFSNSPHPFKLEPGQFADAIARLNQQSADKPIYILSPDYGRLKGGKIIKGKRLVSITVDPWGGVRTERGGKPIDSVTERRSLLEIIASSEFQSIFRMKVNGADDAPDDGGRRVIRDESYRILELHQ